MIIRYRARMDQVFQRVRARYDLRLSLKEFKKLESQGREMARGLSEMFTQTVPIPLEIRFSGIRRFKGGPEMVFEIEDRSRVPLDSIQGAVQSYCRLNLKKTVRVRFLYTRHIRRENPCLNQAQQQQPRKTGRTLKILKKTKR